MADREKQPIDACGSEVNIKAVAIHVFLSTSRPTLRWHLRLIWHPFGSRFGMEVASESRFVLSNSSETALESKASHLPLQSRGHYFSIVNISAAARLPSFRTRAIVASWLARGLDIPASQE